MPSEEGGNKKKSVQFPKEKTKCVLEGGAEGYAFFTGQKKNDDRRRSRRIASESGARNRRFDFPQARNGGGGGGGVLFWSYKKENPTEIFS